VLKGLAHTAVCVPDVDAAVRWYEAVLGLIVIWPATLMDGDDIQRDMGELIAPPVALRAAILGVGESSDRVLEVIEYPNVEAPRSRVDTSVTDHGFTHVGLICDDIAATRADLEAKGVEFLTRGIAEIAGLRTTWFRDPWRNVFILMEKRVPAQPYYRQF
jgi:catechol 2,3-dioxygenase-like lactoylglutathione lyase family enzyme